MIYLNLKWHIKSYCENTKKHDSCFNWLDQKKTISRQGFSTLGRRNFFQWRGGTYFLPSHQNHPLPFHHHQSYNIYLLRVKNLTMDRWGKQYFAPLPPLENKPCARQYCWSKWHTRNFSYGLIRFYQILHRNQTYTQIGQWKSIYFYNYWNKWEGCFCPDSDA